MSLREQAESDLGVILEDNTTGFAWTIKVTSPSLTVVPDMLGFSDDIAQSIDPDTGQIVSGRIASVALRISTIYEKFPSEGIPKGITSSALKPWIIEFDDINGLPYKFKVMKSNPDRTIGLVTLLLELYK